MGATLNQHNTKEGFSLSLAFEQSLHENNHHTPSKIQPLHTPASLVLPSRVMSHNTKAGLNPIVDAAGYLFSVLGKLMHLKSYRHLDKLQLELLQEITILHETIQNLGYSSEYITVCKYVLCATMDEIISNTSWGGQGQWEAYCLLGVLNQDTQHQDKFFSIMERAIKEPALYIDLMELMYLCLSMGYKGQYHATENGQHQLDQITNNLYKHIRAYRGSFSKTLSPTSIKAHKSSATHAHQTPLSFIFIVTACIIMTIFVSLGYLMDVISNEAYKSITQSGSTVPYHPSA